MKNSAFKIFKKSRRKLSGHGLGKYTIVQKISNQLAKTLHPNYVIHDGNKFFLDKDDSIHYSLAENEPLTSNHISKIIHNACAEGNIVIDVGANIGWYTLQYAKLVGSKGKVFAFEPVSENFELLKRNVAENNYKNISCVQKAVSNQVKKVTMELSSRIGDHRIIQNTTSQKTTIQVDCTTLDIFFKEKNKIDFLKIDAEGFDFFVLEGAKQIIEKNRNIVIFIEFNPYLLNLNSVKPETLIDFLRFHGFVLYDVENIRHAPSTIPELLKYNDGTRTSMTNLLCIRN
jgi:FkbM family methyltransferase